MRIFLLIFAASISSLLLVLDAHAKYITIVSNAQITATKEDGSLRITGTYSIKNSGDESAHDVFPVLKFREWKWAGKPEIIAPGDSKSWSIDEKFEAKGFSKGDLVILADRLYRDANGYAFSAPDVVILNIGSLSGTELAELKTPPLRSKINCEGSGNSYYCYLSLNNNRGSELPLKLTVHTSSNLTVSDPIREVSLKGDSESTIRIDLTNFTGLNGSSYPVFLIAEWQDDDLNFSPVISSLVSITPKGHFGFAIIGSVCLFVFLSGLIYLKVFRGMASSANRASSAK